MHKSNKAELQKRVDEKTAQLRKKKPKKEEPFHGEWSISSVSNSKWNAQGTSNVGGDQKPPEIREKVKWLKKKLGEPPRDLEWIYTLK